MKNEPLVRVELARFFVKALKYLRKKCPHIVEDVQPLIARLESGETPGDQMQGTKYTVYKARLKSSDQAKGKRGGFRAIYYIKAHDVVFLVTIYAKSEQADMRPDENPAHDRGTSATTRLAVYLRRQIE